MRHTSTVAAITLVVLAALTTPAAARIKPPQAPASASRHGRAIRHPLPAPRRIHAVFPLGWSLGAVSRGSGYDSPTGSLRVREVQRRLIQLRYRPGPIDGLFGPRTEAATRWFQYRQGLRPTGRVGPVTIVILRALSEHRHVPRARTPRSTRTKPRAQTKPRAKAKPRTVPSSPSPARTAAPEHDSGTPILALVIGIGLALLAGLFVGGRLPRRRTGGRPVLGYVARGGSDAVEATAPALEDACARHDWSLVRIVQESDDAGLGLARRPGLLHALEQIEEGAADGLVVTALRDFTTRFADLAALMQWLTDADGFLAAIDDDLDTSTPRGRATATAVIDIASWRRQPFRGEPPELEPRIAALEDLGVPAASIADALNLAGVPAPNGHDGWRPADVAAASRRAQEART